MVVAEVKPEPERVIVVSGELAGIEIGLIEDTETSDDGLQLGTL